MIIKIVSSAVILVLLLIGQLCSADRVCGIQNFQDKIINGNETAIDEYPWTVLIRYKHQISNKENWGCGGSLVGIKTILTAAHCVDEMAIMILGQIQFVRLGEYNYSTERDCVKLNGFEDCTDDPIDIKVTKSVIYPGTNSNSKLHDIAILILERIPPYTDFIRPICLPDRTLSLDDLNNKKGVLYVTGWGWTIGAVHSPSSVKRHAPVNYVHTNNCRMFYRNINEVRNGECVVVVKRLSANEFQICAGGQNGQNACRGDSGGPLMYSTDNKWTITGIISFGPLPCGRDGIDGVPAVFTRISSYLPWIKSVLLDNDPDVALWDK